MAALGSRIVRSSPYHPQTCGKVERHHQTLKNWLSRQPAQPATMPELQALLDAYQDYYNNRRHHTAIGTAPRKAWDAAGTRGGPGHLPRQNDATIHKVIVSATGTIKAGQARISVGTARAGQHLTAIRDHDRLTVYDAAGEPIGRIRIDYTRNYQGTLKPAA